MDIERMAVNSILDYSTSGVRQLIEGSGEEKLKAHYSLTSIPPANKKRADLCTTRCGHR